LRLKLGVKNSTLDRLKLLSACCVKLAVIFNLFWVRALDCVYCTILLLCNFKFWSKPYTWHVLCTSSATTSPPCHCSGCVTVSPCLELQRMSLSWCFVYLYAIAVLASRTTWATNAAPATSKVYVVDHQRIRSCSFNDGSGLYFRRPSFKNCISTSLFVKWASCARCFDCNLVMACGWAFHFGGAAPMIIQSKTNGNI
jgi:hypothetical protein